MVRVKEERWRRADILLVSDGEFPLPGGITAAVDEARQAGGLRVHGLLIGSSSSAAMQSICQPLHRFTEWGSLNRGV
jgi:uncharacterized protein with von Willebrand factor type A (vWA) domain